MKQYVIMLDYLLESNKNHWPISASSDDLDKLRKEEQHDGAPPLEPRQNYKMDKQEAKSLQHSGTTEVHEGAIYKATAKSSA